MSLAHMVVENQQLDFNQVIETRFEPDEEMDVIHQLKDGSYIYEENLMDWDDDTGRSKMFKTFFLSNRLNFLFFKNPMVYEEYYEEAYYFECGGAV